MKTILNLMLALAVVCTFSVNNAQAQQEGMIGEVKMFAGNFAPRGWMFCEGQLLPIAQHSALFSILGTIYGGDGRTTFALPDLRGRVPVGVGNGPGLTPHDQGEKNGSETTTLNATNIPNSTITNIPAYKVDPTNDSDTFTPGNTSVLTVGNAANSTVRANGTGTNQAVNNMQPYLGMHYIICIQGTFPSRSE